MYINDETLDLVIGLINASENMTRDKLAFQAILEDRVPHWQDDYERLKIDEGFQKRLTVTLADLIETRRVLFQLVKSQKDGLMPPSSGGVQ